jgi:2-keto-4-pentenoate hydratase/2-oxohepta-3-ene-1,7-dioic acid hydratase in catechol pathway
MKIIGIGHNYKKHIEELHFQVPKEPIFFLKPESAMITRNRPFFLPEFSNEIDYEVELIVKIDKVGKYIGEKFAHTYYHEIGLGIDFTARDLQRRCRETGQPWEICKAFDGSAIVGGFLPKERFVDVQNISFSLHLNDQQVQQGNSGNMLFSINTIISYISQFMTLKMGDLIFTGTPQGVGAVAINDRLTGFIEDEKMLDFRIK